MKEEWEGDNKSRVSKDERDIKSEYDYGNKKKFVDVLGNIKTQTNGLKGLEDF
jgi:hypothetical protein